MSTHAAIERQQIVEGDSLPTLELVLTDSNMVDVTDLTGYAAWFCFWKRGATTYTYVGQGYIFNAGAGVARYHLTGAEFPVAGEYEYQAVFTDPYGYELVTPIFKRTVLPKVGT